MSRLGWQALFLVPLLALILVLGRALRTRAGGRILSQGARFLIVSVLAHAGLLFALDLVLISIPVVEAHKDMIESAIVKTFSIFPTAARGGASPSWETLSEGPPPVEPAVEPIESRAVAGKDLAFDPALSGIAPTIPDALARALPPDRVLFLPRPSPSEVDAPPSDLPRAVAVLPELPKPEPPELSRVKPAPEPAPEAPTIAIDRQTTDPRPATADAVGVPSIEPRMPAPVAAHVPAVEPVIDSAPPLELARLSGRKAEDFRDAPPDVANPAMPPVSEPPTPLREPAATLPRASAKEMVPPQDPSPPLREIARLDPPPRTLDLPPLKLDAPPPVLPEMRLPAPPDAALNLPIEPPDLSVSFSMRPPEVRKELVNTMGGNEASEAAVERGLAWLAAHQGPSGNWSLDDLHCQGHHCDARGTIHSDSAATGMALMAFLGAGHSANKGTHAAAVRRGVEWLVTHQRPDGSLAEPSGSQLYGHGLATIALCEAFGLGADPALGGPSAKAVKFIVDAQDPKSGGWRYTPRSGGDTSVLGWQLMALKSAEMAGLPVPAETYRLASKWLDSVAAGPDRARYSYLPGSEATPTMTAEALLCRQYLGTPRSAVSMTAGGRYLRANLPDWGARHTYYWYYATQVMYHLQGDDWSAWNGKLREMLVVSQEKDGPAAGSWHPSRPSTDNRGDRVGRVYETAFSLLMLEVYYRHLPLYQQLSGGGAVGRR